MQCPIICIHKQGCRNLFKLDTYVPRVALLVDNVACFSPRLSVKSNGITVMLCNDLLSDSSNMY